MKRRYTRAEVMAFLNNLREKAASLPLDTHVLFGYPGETDRDFRDTGDLVRAIRFDRAQVYRYTDRPNTSTCSLPDKVDEDVKRKRVGRLLNEFQVAGAPPRNSKGRDSDHGSTDSSMPSFAEKLPGVTAGRPSLPRHDAPVDFTPPSPGLSC